MSNANLALVLPWSAGVIGYKMVNTFDNYNYIPYSPNRLLVRLVHLHVVHVGLPVLNIAAMVAGHHPAVVVRPHHRPHRNVVGLLGNIRLDVIPRDLLTETHLQNGLEIKG